MNIDKLNKDLNLLVFNKQETPLRNPLEPYIKLYIEPFHYCNYDCSYCYLGKKNKTEINYKKLYWFLEKKFIPEIEKRIFNHLQLKNKKIGISIVGGEISLKPISFFEEFFNKLFSIFKKSFNIITFSYLTNFFRPLEYYIEINEIINKIKLKYNYNVSISFCASLHEEFDNLKNFINKIYNADKNGLDICCNIFKTREELLNVSDPDLLEKINYIYNSNILKIKTIDDLKYKNFLEKYKNQLRPVKCYAYNFKIKPDLTIIQRCFGKKFSVFSFKPKLYYFCDKTCSCAADEGFYRKELLLKEKNEGD